MAYDAICSFPAGVTVTRDTVSPVFGAPFGRLTATVDGDIIAITTRFWDIAEGLHDLLGYATTALADDVTAVLDGDMVDRYDDDDAVVCDACGGPCDAADAVTDDCVNLCGGFYGNGCADDDNDAGAMLVDGVFVARVTRVTI
jgi:hypothetical protein